MSRKFYCWRQQPIQSSRRGDTARYLLLAIVCMCSARPCTGQTYQENTTSGVHGGVGLQKLTLCDWFDVRQASPVTLRCNILYDHIFSVHCHTSVDSTNAWKPSLSPTFLGPDRKLHLQLSLAWVVCMLRGHIQIRKASLSLLSIRCKQTVSSLSRY